MSDKIRTLIAAYLIAAIAGLKQRAHDYWEAGEAIAADETVEAGGWGRDTRAQLGQDTVIAGLTVVVVAFAALIAVDNLDTSVGSLSDGNLSDARNSVLAGFADMASLIGPVLIIGMIAVLIAIIRRVR